MHMIHNTHSELKQLVDIFEVCVHECVHIQTFCVFPGSFVQLGAVVGFHLVFLTHKTSHRQRQICIMLILFPNMSVTLEQICVFKISITGELTVPVRNSHQKQQFQVAQTQVSQQGITALQVLSVQQGLGTESMKVEVMVFPSTSGLSTWP